MEVYIKKIKTFIKQWTLPIAIVVGTLLYIIFAYTPQLDAAGDFMLPVFEESMPYFLFFILFVTFCKVNFREMMPCMWHLKVCLAQFVMVALIVLITLLFFNYGTPKILLEGVLACIICPTATAATVVTVKLDGNLNSMTAYTLISNIAASVMIPLFLPMLEIEADISFFSAFLIILRKVLLVLALPLLCAYIVRHYIPFLYNFITGIKDLAFYMWASSLTIITGITVRNIFHADISLSLLLYIAAGAMIICLLQFFIGKALGRKYGASINSGQALGQKNTVFAIWIAGTYLNPLSTLGPGFYILWQNIVNGWQLWKKAKNK